MKNTLFIFVLLMPLLIIPHQLKAKDIKFVIGINTGYSFGLSDEYGKEEDKSERYYYKEGTKLGSHIGGYVLIYLSSHWGICGEFNYQRKIYTKEYIDYVDPTYNSSITKNESFTKFYLSGIYKFNDFKKNNLFPYLCAGIGRWNYEKEEFIWFIMKTGVGLKYHFSPHGALNLGIFPYWSLLNFEIEFLSLNFGLEYGD